MMKVWKIVLTLLFLPPAILYHFSKIFLGKERARNYFYNFIVSVSAGVLAWNIPALKKGQPFSMFSDNFIKALSRMPFEDIQVAIQTEDTFQLNITRCQFVEVFLLLGMPELTPALCHGDVLFCEKYQPLIGFQRRHNLAAGDDFCDHTYFLEKNGGR